MSKLLTNNLTVGYGKPLIEDIAMKVEAGKITVLIGANGVGKSTILKSVAGLLKPIKGVVTIDDVNLSDISSKEVSRKMSLMMTGRSEVEYSSCFDVVSVGRYQFTNIFGKINDSDKKIIEETMKETGAFEYKDTEFSKLSDGQKQRVLLARALVQEPEILVLDEPTSFLDIAYKLEFAEKLKKLAKDKNIGILMSMHEIELVKNIADMVVCISMDGRIDRIAASRDVFTKDYIKSLYQIDSKEFDSTYGFIFDKETENFNSNSINASTNIIDSKKSNKSQDKMNSLKDKVNDENKISKTKYIMVQGTMSSAGKSLIVAGLCRIFMQDGYKVSPFKSQNMALNSFITEDGLEMGRAQVMQAEAAGIKPSVYMNPILLKPTDDKGSQVIVNGKAIGNMRAREYFAYKTSLIPDIKKALSKLSEDNDIIVIEGAGSPAEINLKENDIVNMGMAKIANAPVVLVGDIDRGGVFAQLLGTIALLEEDERNRVKGLIINKFRGDKTILDPGIKMLEDMSNINVVGVIPYMDIKVDDEDSLSERFNKKVKGLINISIIRLPHISNFTDFDVFEQINNVSINYITNPWEVDLADLLIIPGSKNTVADMKWIKESGMEVAILKYANKDKPLIGICGGYQMLGESIKDPKKVEGGFDITGLGLLPVRTVLESDKTTSQVEGKFVNSEGIFEGLKDIKYKGYEIHMGKTISFDNINDFTENQTGFCKGNIYGSYVHGLFDEKEVVTTIVDSLAKKLNIKLDLEKVTDYQSLKEKEYDRLADTMRGFLNMKEIYQMMGINND